MTTLALLDFTTNQQASNRVLAMGEEPWRVHTVGFPAIDLIQDGNFDTPQEVCERLGLDLSRPVALFTQHSVTTEFDQARAQVAPALLALERLAAEGVQIVVTYPNNDAGGRHIIAALNDWLGQGRPGIQVRASLGRYFYHGVLALARDADARVACLGNSSSGIKETPAFGCPTVNIGSRQLGRLRGANVLDAGYDADEIAAATRRCLSDAQFRKVARDVENPYGVGDAGPKVAAVLASVPLGQSLLRKGMTLRGEARDGWYR
jgi:UDP-N-acetylglucosamine 2-epimerase (non-hydrolysing)/GDP/UDP-N,N'-diacetylbacillosamine 2-epimerase (hydrolysing)